jgi:hypothetical protein
MNLDIHEAASRAYRKWCKWTNTVYQEPSHGLSEWEGGAYVLRNVAGTLASYKPNATKTGLVRVAISTRATP